MASLANGRFPLRLGLHELNTEQRGTRSATETGWTCPNGPTGLGLFWAGSGPFFSLRLILIFCTWPLHLCHHHRDQDKGIFMYELSIFSSQSTRVLHSSTLVLATFGG
jgi:hypothetical protein